MAGQREKTLSYRRAERFTSSTAPELEKCVRQALKQLKTIEERTINRDGRSAKVAKDQEASPAGLFLHIATETPGEPASVVPKVEADAIAVDLKTEKPPEDGEWLDGDGFLYINDDHVCLCTTGIHDRSIANFLRHLFEKAKLPQPYRDFDLMKAADIGRLNMLHKQGVRELEIRGTLYKATADYVRRKRQVTGVLGAVGKELKILLNKPHDVTPDALRVALTIKVDRRSKKHLALGEKHIEDLAANVVSHTEAQDDYVIVTGTGQKISPDEIFMKSTASIEAAGKTVDRDKTWKELQRFYDQLKSSGVFEQ